MTPAEERARGRKTIPFAAERACCREDRGGQEGKGGSIGRLRVGRSQRAAGKHCVLRGV